MRLQIRAHLPWDFWVLRRQLVCNFEESERICLGNFLGLEEANNFRNFVEWWECYTPTSIAEMDEEVTT